MVQLPTIRLTVFKRTIPFNRTIRAGTIQRHTFKTASLILARKTLFILGLKKSLKICILHLTTNKQR